MVVNGYFFCAVLQGDANLFVLGVGKCVVNGVGNQVGNNLGDSAGVAVEWQCSARRQLATNLLFAQQRL